MLFYNIILSILLIISLLYSQYRNRLLILLQYFILFIISALRFDIGWDYPLYYSLASDHCVSNVSNLAFHSKRMEPLIKIMLNISNYFNNPFLFFIIESFLICLFLYIATIKLTKHPHIFIILLFILPHYFIDSFTLIRQWIALSITFYSIRFIIENKPVKFILIIIFASLFHTTALIFLVSYFLKYIRISKLLLVIIIISSFLLGQLIISYLTALDLPYFSYLRDKAGVGGKLFGILSLLILLISFPFLDKYNKKDQLLINMLIVGTSVSLLLSQFGHIAFRLPIYFVLPSTLLLINPLIKIKPKFTIAVLFIIISFSMLNINLLTSKTNEKDPNVPYMTIFFSNPDKIRKW